MNATDPALTPFSHLLADLLPRDSHFSISLPPDWLQGRTAYGGLSAALALQAALLTFPGLPPLRSAQMVFFAPATGTLRFRPSVLRRGKSAAFINVDIEGENGACARTTFCFGEVRPIDQDYVELPCPVASPVDACPNYFTWPKQPNFRQHFEGRLAAGGRPGMPSRRPEMLVWMRHRDQHVAADHVSLLALADALPPGALTMYHEPVPISTMTWSIDLLNVDCTPGTDRWWLIQCMAENVQDGYSAQSTKVWNSAGRPIVVARQTVAIFRKAD